MEEKKCNQCEEIKPLGEYYTQDKVNAKGEEYIYYTPKCKACVREASKKWGIENYERKLQSNAKHDKKERRRKLLKVYRKKRVLNGKFKEWQNEHKDKIKEYNAKRRHKNHDITKDEWESCKKYFNYSCAYCGLSESESKEKYNQVLHKEHVDHSGKNDLSNCVPACRSCNSRKRDYELTDWYNKNNDEISFSQERLDKVMKWINEDYLKYQSK